MFTSVLLNALRLSRSAVPSAMSSRSLPQGERRGAVLIAGAREIFASEPEVRVDYIAVADWFTLLPVEIAVPGTLFAVAAVVGKTRLIDNAILQ